MPVLQSLARKMPVVSFFASKVAPYLSEVTIEVIVGGGEDDHRDNTRDKEDDSVTKSFYISKALLSNVSPKFKAMLNNSTFTEAQERRMVLADDSIRTFEYFIAWLFTGDAHNASIDVYPGLNVMVPWVTLWTFGDKHCIPTFQDYAMTNMLKVYHDLAAIKTTFFMDSSEVGYAYTHTAKGSKLRAFYCAICAWRDVSFRGEWVDVLDANPDIVEEFVVATEQRKANEADSKSFKSLAAPWDRKKEFLVSKGDLPLGTPPAAKKE